MKKLLFGLMMAFSLVAGAQKKLVIGNGPGTVTGGGGGGRETFLSSGQFTNAGSGQMTWNAALGNYTRVRIYFNRMTAAVNTDNFKVHQLLDSAGNNVTDGSGGAIFVTQQTPGAGSNFGYPAVLWGNLSNHADDGGIRGYIEIDLNNALKRPTLDYELRGRAGDNNSASVIGNSWYSSVVNRRIAGMGWQSNGGTLSFTYQVYGIK